MNVIVLYTHNTPADRDIAYLQRKLEEAHIPVTLTDADSRAGAALCELYDLVARPAVVITDSGGRLLEQWQGEVPPPLAVQNAYQSAT